MSDKPECQYEARLPELKPCPFCGGVAKLYETSDDRYPFQARCDDGDCYGWHDSYAYTTEEAARNWNKRA